MDRLVGYLTGFTCFILGFVCARVLSRHHRPKPNVITDNPQVDRYCIHCTWCIDPQSVSPRCGKFRDPVGKPRYCINLRRPDEDCGPQGKSWEPITTMEEKQ